MVPHVIARPAKRQTSRASITLLPRRPQSSRDFSANQPIAHHLPLAAMMVEAQILQSRCRL